MYGKKKSNLFSALSVIVIFLLLFLSVGYFVKHPKVIDDIKDLFNTSFRVEYDGKDYTGTNNVVAFPLHGQAKFKVKGANGYTVSLAPNVAPEGDFRYSVGSNVYTYSKTDISKVFISDNNVQNGYFCLNELENYSISAVLKKLYDGAEVELDGKVKYPYLLTFRYNDDSVSFLLSPEIILSLSESSIIF